MRLFLHRFFWKTPDKRFTPFLPFFTTLNLIIGITFVIGAKMPNVGSMVLFQLLNDLLPASHGSAIWGSILIATFIGHCIAMYYRRARIGAPVAMLGFMAWIYAFTIYVIQQAPLGILAISFPQLFFWGWYFIIIKRYRKELDEDMIQSID